MLETMHEDKERKGLEKNPFVKMSDDSREEYLESMLLLKQAKGLIRPVDLAHNMGYSKASISRAVAKLAASDLVLVDSEGFLDLTERGEALARRSHAKTSFFSKILTKAGVDSDRVDFEARRMQRALSDDSFALLQKLVLACEG